MWPYMFSLLADEYDRRYGLDDTHLDAISALNYANARANPNAQTRSWSIDPRSNPSVEGRIRRLDCSQMTDGGAAVVLVNDTYLRNHPTVRPIARIDWLLAVQRTTSASRTRITAYSSVGFMNAAMRRCPLLRECPRRFSFRMISSL